MEAAPTEELENPHDEKLTRVRVGATGLAVIVLVVLLAASFSGTASNEPELTPEAMAQDAASGVNEATLVEEQPQEPLAELGVAPTTGPTAGPAAGEGAAAPDSTRE